MAIELRETHGALGRNLLVVIDGKATGIHIYFEDVDEEGIVYSMIQLVNDARNMFKTES
jgi:hypothetical protein